MVLQREIFIDIETRKSGYGTVNHLRRKIEQKIFFKTIQIFIYFFFILLFLFFSRKSEALIWADLALT